MVKDAHYVGQIMVSKSSDLKFSRYGSRLYFSLRRAIAFFVVAKIQNFSNCPSGVSFPMFIDTRNRLQLLILRTVNGYYY